MIETHAILLLIAIFGVPCILGLVYALITRPSKYYYKHNGYYWKRKKF